MRPPPRSRRPPRPPNRASKEVEAKAKTVVADVAKSGLLAKTKAFVDRPAVATGIAVAAAILCLGVAVHEGGAASRSATAEAAAIARADAAEKSSATAESALSALKQAPCAPAVKAPVASATRLR